jgi:hypothetical protein
VIEKMLQVAPIVFYGMGGVALFTGQVLKKSIQLCVQGRQVNSCIR